MTDRRLCAYFHASYGWDVHNGGTTSRARKATKRLSNQKVRRVPLEPDEHLEWVGPRCADCEAAADPGWYFCAFCGGMVA